MGRGGTATAERAAFLDRLTAAGVLVPSGGAGVYAWNADFERVRLGVEAFLGRAAAPELAEQLRFPPVLARRDLEDVGYLRSFPHLLGSVFSFAGDEDDAAEQEARATRHDDWSEFQRMTDLVLVPAACYPIYPIVARRGPLPPGGVRIDAGGVCVFRHEPSPDPARMQLFHQFELVCIGEPSTVVAWRDAWGARAGRLLAELGLEAEVGVATDAFFGRSGRFLATSQREQLLKFEATTTIAGGEPTALASFNYHQEHFGTVFGLVLADGGVAHSACVGFGEERIVLALLDAHGLDLDTWPAEIRAALWEAA